MQFAVIKTGGKQYKVAEGDVLRVEKLESKDGEVVFDSVLLVVNGEVKLGKPVVSGAKVSAKSSIEESVEVVKLKAELTELQEKEMETTSEKDLRQLRREIVSVVKSIETQEKKERASAGWPTVTIDHVKEVVADWVGMKVKDIH